MVDECLKSANSTSVIGVQLGIKERGLSQVLNTWGKKDMVLPEVTRSPVYHQTISEKKIISLFCHNDL